MTFAPIRSFEPLDRATWERIRNNFTPAQAIVAGINFVDFRYGAGVIDAHTKCIWTTTKRRVVLSYKDGAVIASLSKVEDPACPSLARSLGN